MQAALKTIDEFKCIYLYMYIFLSVVTYYLISKSNAYCEGSQMQF